MSKYADSDRTQDRRPDAGHNPVSCHEMPKARTLCHSEDARQVKYAPYNQQHVRAVLIEYDTDWERQEPSEEEVDSIDPCDCAVWGVGELVGRPV